MLADYSACVVLGLELVVESAVLHLLLALQLLLGIEAPLEELLLSKTTILLLLFALKFDLLQQDVYLQLVLALHVRDLGQNLVFSLPHILGLILIAQLLKNLLDLCRFRIAEV